MLISDKDRFIINPGVTAYCEGPKTIIAFEKRRFILGSDTLYPIFSALKSYCNGEDCLIKNIPCNSQEKSLALALIKLLHSEKLLSLTKLSLSPFMRSIQYELYTAGYDADAIITALREMDVSIRSSQNLFSLLGETLRAYSLTYTRQYLDSTTEIALAFQGKKHYIISLENNHLLITCHSTPLVIGDKEPREKSLLSRLAVTEAIHLIVWNEIRQLCDLSPIITHSKPLTIDQHSLYARTGEKMKASSIDSLSMTHH